MEYIISETQIKKFKKENLNKGKYGDGIERLISYYIDPSLICDVAVFQTEHDESMYVALILFNGYSAYNLSGKLEKFINNFLPVKLMVLINESECN